MGRIINAYRRREIQKFINPILFLLSLNLFSLNLGCFSSLNHRIYGFSLLVGFLIFNFPAKIKIEGLKKLFLGIFVLFWATVIIFLNEKNTYWLLAIPVFIFGLDLILTSLNSKIEELHIFLLTSVLYVFIYILSISMPFFWYTTRQLSLWFSSIVGHILLNQTLSVGPSTGGCWIFISFLVYMLSLFWLYKKSLWQLVLAIIGLGVVNIAFLIIQNVVPLIKQNAIRIVNSQVIFFFLGLIPIWCYTNKELLTSYIFLNVRQQHQRVFGAVLIVVSLAVGLLNTFPEGSSKDVQKTVLILDEGYVDWKTPVFGKYGPYEVGLFGLLPRYLEGQGYNTKIWKGDLNLNVLTDTHILVIINPQKKWSQKEMELIWGFVEKGGGLLVLGDHTNLLGIADSLNQLLVPVSIGFNFDSGYPCFPEWRHSYGFLSHPINEGLTHWNDVVISIGASLSISPPTFPIIIGKYGFSDTGNILNVQGAYLGDYAYQAGEQLGDVVLVAGRYYGKGKVVVFGDTSPFQNTALSYCFMPFVQNVLKWLTIPGAVKIYYLRQVGMLVAILITIVLCKRVRFSRINLLLCSVSLLFSFMLSSYVNLNKMQHDELKGPIAWIDISHGERCSLAPLQHDSIGGLITNLIRNGFMPLLLREFPKERLRGSVLILIAPSKILSPSEMKQIKEFMEQGGVVVISAGAEDKESSMMLLKELELDIATVPLGPVPIVRSGWDAKKDPQFVNAWPVISTNNGKRITRTIREPYQHDSIKSKMIRDPQFPFRWQKETFIDYPDRFEEQSFGSDEDITIFYQTGNLATVVFKCYGKGGILLIGDTYFLGDGNLENIKYYVEGNILFLKNIFDELRTRGRLK